MDETSKHRTFPPDLIRLPGYVVDIKRESLRKETGDACEIRPQAFAVLKYLALNAGRLVTKKELLVEVWRGMMVTDDSLVQAIGDIRRAIDDPQHHVIKTVPRRGYMLIADNSMLPANSVEELALSGTSEGPNAPDASPSPKSVKWRNWVASGFVGVVAIAGLLGLRQYDAQERAQAAQRAAVPDRPTLAVLPFKNLSADAEGDLLGQGFADDLIVQLARNADLRVIARYSSFSFKDKDVPIQEIARKLGARYLVDGGVRHGEDVLRITVQVIDSESGRVVWSASENTNAAQVLTTRDALVQKIAGSVHVTMRFDQESQALRRPPKVLDAYTLTLRAIAHKHQLTPASIKAGRADAEQAIALDPNYAPAWVYLGYINLIDAGANFTGEWTPLRINEAIAQVNKGIALDPTLPIAYQALSNTLSMAGRTQEALVAAQRSVELGPSDPDNLLFLAKAQVEQGLVADAIKTIGEGQPLYPIKPIYFEAFHARILWAAGNFDQAIAEADECLRKAPRFLACRVERASALVESGAVDAAKAEVKAMLEFAPSLTTTKFIEAFKAVPELRARRLAAAVAAGLPEPTQR